MFRLYLIYVRPPVYYDEKKHILNLTRILMDAIENFNLLHALGSILNSTAISRKINEHNCNN